MAKAMKQEVSIRRSVTHKRLLCPKVGRGSESCVMVVTGGVGGPRFDRAFAAGRAIAVGKSKRMPKLHKDTLAELFPDPALCCIKGIWYWGWVAKASAEWLESHARAQKVHDDLGDMGHFMCLAPVRSGRSGVVNARPNKRREIEKRNDASVPVVICDAYVGYRLKPFTEKNRRGYTVSNCCTSSADNPALLQPMNVLSSALGSSTSRAGMVDHVVVCNYATIYQYELTESGDGQERCM
eukprot:56522-Eustigmatos_ZCMA.PRE.1